MPRQKKDPFDTTSSHVIWGIFLVCLVAGIVFYIYFYPSTGKLADHMRTPVSVPLSETSIKSVTTSTDASAVNENETKPANNSN